MIEDIGESISADPIVSTKDGRSVFILRGHPDGQSYGGEILGACTVVLDTIKSEGIVHALVCNNPGDFNRKKFNAMAKWMRSRGIKKITWSRAVNGKFVDKEL